MFWIKYCTYCIRTFFHEVFILSRVYKKFEDIFIDWTESILHEHIYAVVSLLYSFFFNLFWTFLSICINLYILKLNSMHLNLYGSLILFEIRTFFLFRERVKQTQNTWKHFKSCTESAWLIYLFIRKFSEKEF